MLKRNALMFWAVILPLIEALGYAASMLVVIALYLVHIFSVVKYPYFSPSSNVEELAYTYISSANFNKFGFLFTDFLQNFAASPDPADHPYVYNHMPPGPDIVNALLMRATDGSFEWTAIILATLVPIGFAFYLAFIRKVLMRYGLAGGGIFATLLTPWLFYLPHFTNPIWNGFLLLSFLPLVMQQVGFEYDKKWPFLFVGLPTILISSLYLDYVVLSSIVACWIALFLTQFIPIRRQEVFLALCAIGLGIGLNLFKNIVYFGPSVFFEELFSVIGNRTIGWPSQNEMAAFYAQHGIVHHGAHPPSVVALKAVVGANFQFSGLIPLLLAACASLFLTVTAKIERNGSAKIVADSGLKEHATWLAKLVTLIVCIILTPILLFPAFSQEVSLYGGTNFVWLGLLAISLAAFTTSRLLGPLALIVYSRPQRQAFTFTTPKTRPEIIRTVAFFGVWIVVLSLFGSEMKDAYVRLSGTKSELLSRYSVNPHKQLEPLRLFDSGTFMTNINVPTVYFFTGRPGFGVCGLNSIGESGDLHLAGCKIAFMRNAKRYFDQHAQYFFYFKLPQYFPGFADCSPNGTVLAEVQQGRAPARCFDIQGERLRKNFQIVFNNDLVTVYDLGRVRT
jgi:hypothetical protein